jgi:hypothetical protein
MKTKIQNTFKNVAYSVLVSFVLFISAAPLAATAQDVPAELNSLVSMKLDDAQTWFGQNGYEIAGSSLFKKEQLWYNEKQNVCVSIAFEKKDDHNVTSVKPGDVAKCKEGVAAARKVTESYHDGPAPANAAAIEKEREKLRAKGFVVSYWIQDAAPGRSTEYWKNESTGDCMHIVWNSADQSDVSTSDCESKYGNNPYPKKK